MTGTIKIFVRTLQQLTFQKLVVLLSLTLPRPLFTLFSFVATVRSYHIAKKYFPQSNSGHGVGNAFRHALWCCLIMMYCCKISSPRKAEKWCVRFTSLHEELFPNEPIETKMDLHNNFVGINLFNEMLTGIHRQFFETSFFVDKLFEKTKTAQILRHVDDEYGNELVYLEKPVS